MSESKGHLLPEGGYARCDQCAFFKRGTLTGDKLRPAEGECRLRGPIASLENHTVGFALWPVVLAHEWCGEFARKVEVRS